VGAVANPARSISSADHYGYAQLKSHHNNVAEHSANISHNSTRAIENSREFWSGGWAYCYLTSL
jgi:hypothetical protein